MKAPKALLVLLLLTPAVADAQVRQPRFSIDQVLSAAFPYGIVAARKIYVDTPERLLEVFENDQLVCVFPITPGSTSLPAPIGTWKIQGAATWPWFRYDEGMLNYGIRTENYFNLPPGPNNLVGVVWMGLDKPGIGMHGTNNPETIGRAASHGCIRLANWDAIRVKDLVSVGNTVIIF